MPDLDQLLDTLVADVTAGSRAPGAATAIKRARRRRATVAASVAGAVAVIAVGGGLAAGTLGDSDQPSPIGEPTTPPSESPTPYDTLGTELHATFLQVPGWAVNYDLPLTDYDYAFNGPCSGNWSQGATSGGDGGPPPGPVGERTAVGIGHAGFPSEARASDAAVRFVDNLTSCTATAWRTQPVARTGAVLATSTDAVAWIHQTGRDVWVLQVPTNDGPPPVGVQAEVAEWMADYHAWHRANRADMREKDRKGRTEP